MSITILLFGNCSVCKLMSMRCHSTKQNTGEWEYKYSHKFKS